MEIPQRKQTRIDHYDYSQAGAYFLTICTQDRKKILSDIVGGGAHDAPQVVLTDIGEIVRKHIVNSSRIPGIKVDKYVVMPDHVHMIIRVDQMGAKGTSRAPSPTNALIPHFVSTFKRFCHREIGWKIFQRSYYDHVIRNQQDYHEVWEYIENNPCKWAMTKQGKE